MTSRERVLRAIEFRGPDRLPLGKGDAGDVVQVGCRPASDFVPDRPGRSEWGCLWTSLNPEAGDIGQVTEHPLADWDAADDYAFPDAYAPGRFDGVAEQIRAHHDRGKFVCGNLGAGPMHMLDNLRGFEAYLVDLLTEPLRIEWMLDGIFAHLCGLVEQFGKLGADAVFMCDDQATQRGPLFSMDIWRTSFKPRYRELFDLAHRHGCKVYMHTCGNLDEHLVDLADAGVDVVDNKQPALWMDGPGASAVRGKVTFSTCIDIQSVVGEIDIEAVDAEVDRLVRTLSTPGGGFIATYYHQQDLKIAPEKNARMLEAFRAFRWDAARPTAAESGAA